MLTTVTSRNGVLIRLTDERWNHITEEHGELVGMRLDVLATISEAECIYAGKEGELLATKKAAGGKWLVSVYRELHR